MFNYILHRFCPCQLDKNELINELYLYLQSDNWYKLRQFDFRSKLTTWLTVVAVRFFQKRKGVLMDYRNQSAPIKEEEKVFDFLPLLTMGKGILIQNVVIFDGKSEKTVTGNVWIEDNAIRKVSAEPIVAGAEVEVIDGRGKFLMPGLIDAHWHAYLAANTMVDLLTAHASYTQLRAGEEAGKTLLRGFTTIRDAGGPVFGLKRAIDEGTLPGPRIYPSGAIISETGGHADFRMVYDIPEPFDCCGLTHTEKIGAAIIADGVDAVIVASRNNLRLGASQIKLMAGGGVSSLYDQLEDVQYFEDELHAAVMAAEDAGTYVMVHVYVPEAIRRAIRAGVKSIEHGQLIDEPTMKLIAEKGVWLSMQPFIGEGNNHYTNPVQQAKHELVVQGTDRAYQLAKKYGVKLAWGTDLLFSPANARNQNLNIEKMTRWFSNFEILKMITHDNAELLALSGRRNPYPGKLGVIEEGALADLIVVDGNALEDIKVLTDPGKNMLLIMKDGKIYKNDL